VFGMTEAMQCTRFRWAILFVAATSVVCAMMITMSLAPLVGEISKDLGIDVGVASFAFLGLPMLVLAAGIGLSGFLIDRLGVFPVIISSQLVIVLATASIAFFGDNYTALLAIRIVQGIGGGGLIAAFTPALALWFPPRELGRVISFQGIAVPIGLMLGLNGGPQLSRVFGSWRFGLSALSVVVLIVLLISLPVAIMARRLRPGGLQRENKGAADSMRILFRMPAFWLGMAMLSLMAIAAWISTFGFATLMIAPAVSAFGLVAFGCLGMGPVTIAVDSYGPVTDNAQSVFELSTIENIPNISGEIQKDFGFTPDFDKGKENLEENDGAGNTFKATAKPVLIGTAVVGATTMIFSIIVALTNKLQPDQLAKLSILYAPFLLGLIAGGAVIYWFTGASMQAVTTGAYRAVEFIKANIKLEGVTMASVTDSKKVVEICTQYAQKGMFNIFLTVFFATLAFAFVEPYFFIGYLISIALFGLYQAIFMANAGGAWDNAKKIVETELKQKGTPLHDATVVGDTVGDPFKDTSSVALNPIIKFTTLFGLLAVELAVSLTRDQSAMFTDVLAAVFLLISVFFVYRSFYGMRIERK